MIPVKMYSINFTNGKILKEASDTSLKTDTNKYGDSQIIVVANNKTECFAVNLQVYPFAFSRNIYRLQRRR